MLFFTLSSADDIVVSQASKSGMFKASDTWQLLRAMKPKVVWHKLVWNQFSLPKHRFIAWLITLEYTFLVSEVGVLVFIKQHVISMMLKRLEITTFFTHN